MVGMFESTLTRTLKLENDELTHDLIIVEVFHKDMFKQLSNDGLMSLKKMAFQSL